ncbi:hypothetical protein [Streptomyces sp. NPDC046985]|uniref:hypothetical protein n=1 Tax=Streptomyces sp. NPDC046985 TaxID=3155377 RepID=UPI0033C714B8
MAIGAVLEVLMLHGSVLPPVLFGFIAKNAGAPLLKFLRVNQFVIDVRVGRWTGFSVINLGIVNDSQAGFVNLAYLYTENADRGVTKRPGVMLVRCFRGDQ